MISTSTLVTGALKWHCIDGSNKRTTDEEQYKADDWTMGGDDRTGRCVLCRQNSGIVKTHKE